MNRKLTLLYFGLVLILTSCSPFENVQRGEINKAKETAMEMKKSVPPSFFPKDLKIVSAGDSLTQGVGDSSHSGGYIPYLDEQLEKKKTIDKVEFENFGVRGNRTDQLLERLKSKKVKSSLEKADIIILTIGGNDLMAVVKKNITSLNVKQFLAEQVLFKERLQSILLTVREQNPHAPIVLIGLYNPFFDWFADVKEINQIVDEWNSQSRSIAEKEGNTYFVDIHDIFLNSEENLLYTDYFHPNDRGYQLIAERIYKTLDEEVMDGQQE